MSCSIEGCERLRKSRGWCNTHYERWRRHGDPRETLNTNDCSVDGCSRKHVGRGYCGMHLQRWRKHGNAETRGSRWNHASERLYRDTRRTGECVERTVGIGINGYSTISVSGKPQLAHRYAWSLANGPIPEGMYIDHRCHNTACVNVEHLRLAAPEQNNWNRGDLHPTNTSGYRGVTWDKNRSCWAAQVSHRGKHMHQRGFSTPEEAAEEARRMRNDLFREFAGRG